MSEVVYSQIEISEEELTKEYSIRATAFTFEEKQKLVQKVYQEKV